MSRSRFLWFFFYLIQIQIAILIADATYKFVPLISGDNYTQGLNSANPNETIVKLPLQCLTDFGLSINEAGDGAFAKTVGRNISKRWLNSTIPFEISPNMSANGVNIIKQAFKHYESVTCLKFKLKSSADEDYIYFDNRPLGCFSNSIGRKGGRQEINLGERLCLKNPKLAIHQIFHALGFTPEHIRPDRDEFITIHWENIAPGLNSSFEKEKDENVDTLGFPYDYRSIVHIRATSGSKNGNVTVSAKLSGQKVGPLRQLSELDVLKIKKLFNCSLPEVTTSASVTNKPTTTKKNNPPRGKTTEKPSPNITTSTEPLGTTTKKPDEDIKCNFDALFSCLKRLFKGIFKTVTNWWH